MNSRFRIAIGLVAAVLAAGTGNAAEVKVISSIGVRGVLEEAQPLFERATPHKLAIVFGTTAPLKRQIEAGETFDVVILTPAMLDDLAKQGRVAGGSVATVAKTGLGLATRKGGPKPGVATPDQLKRALLDTKSLAYSKEGLSGLAAVRVIERLGLAEELKPKTLIETRSGGPITALMEGKVDMSFALMSEIIPSAEVDLIGPIPGELQSYAVFAAGTSSAAKDPQAVKAFIDFLRGPAVAPILKAKGMEGG